MKKLVVLFIIVISFNLNAEVISAENHGFEINIERVVNVEQKTVYAQFLKVEEWWSSDHTYFGDSNNLGTKCRVLVVTHERGLGYRIYRHSISTGKQPFT